MTEDDGVDDVRALLPGEALQVVETLRASERSVVQRVTATRTDGGRRRLIVKRYLGQDEGWLRETAALECVPGAVRVPDIVAVGDDLLVTEDLGTGASLADALLGEDPALATHALTNWATALGELHAATVGSRQHFAAALTGRAAAVIERRGDDGRLAHEPSESWLPARLREAERVLDRNCGALGVTIPAGAMSALTGLSERLGGEATAALTPADACPDNNVHVGDRLVLLDFEGAQWRHVAWDVAYLTVPWPTCWCSWDVPDAAAAAALDAYRTAAAGALPEVADDAFLHDVDAATVGWALISSTWSLDYALGPEVDAEPDDDAEPTPTRRQVILHRLGVAARVAEIPPLAELAGSLHAELERRWGGLTLDLAPAYRPR